ncbi:Radical SAM superfamily [[Clostridium] sordellii]|uniref:radical SAM protein n=1 Tax=Paraclostridium sordellii TaxID=1505 RepID=UPI0005E87D57|nr:radical SAM protein [Paeniclostridium sordellii]CEN89845.1 Radical SAM superfamily [[Clostridium] sordellii] [Paeniclostridium sordellii]CEQ10374.1 Radical SAM superfamily [[Clostridium] sordellii] [Paeniclostridium sordellii]
MKNLIYGNKERIFINTALGCNSMCSYCYLSDIGIDGKVKYFKAEHIIEKIEKMDQFKKGKHGTIISIGCYSECWDNKNKYETIKVIKYFIKTNNYIQLATKREILLEELKEINKLIKYKNQLNIYISIPTISQSDVIEVGTDRVEKRINNFNLKDKLNNINFVLYIKPVIKNVTVLDIDSYISIVKQYNLDVVIGDILTVNSEIGKVADVGEEMLYEDEVEDAVVIRSKLNEYTKVYEHSTDIIKINKLYNQNLRGEE